MLVDLCEVFAFWEVLLGLWCGKVVPWAGMSRSTIKYSVISFCYVLISLLCVGEYLPSLWLSL
jgi:hypothetical protein